MGRAQQEDLTHPVIPEDMENTYGDETATPGQGVWEAEDTQDSLQTADLSAFSTEP